MFISKTTEYLEKCYHQKIVPSILINGFLFSNCIDFIRKIKNFEFDIGYQYWVFEYPIYSALWIFSDNPHDIQLHCDSFVLAFLCCELLVPQSIDFLRRSSIRGIYRKKAHWQHTILMPTGVQKIWKYLWKLFLQFIMAMKWHYRLGHCVLISKPIKLCMQL